MSISIIQPKILWSTANLIYILHQLQCIHCNKQTSDRCGSAVFYIQNMLFRFIDQKSRHSTNKRTYLTWKWQPVTIDCQCLRMHRVQIPNLSSFLINFNSNLRSFICFTYKTTLRIWHILQSYLKHYWNFSNYSVIVRTPLILLSRSELMGTIEKYGRTW